MAPPDKLRLVGTLALGARRLRVVRVGPGANCSSIGSALDVVFMSSVAGAALLAAVACWEGAKGQRGKGAKGPTGAKGSEAHEGAGQEPEATQPEQPRVRLDDRGAWVRLRDDLLVAVDHEGAAEIQSRSLSSSGPFAPLPLCPSAPLEAHVAVTARCAAGCEHCYVDARADGAEPPFEVVAGTLRALAAAGVFTVAFGGGEPLTRSDLPELAAVARSVGLVPVMTTSGLGLGVDRARTLRAFAQVNVSYDGVGRGYGAVRGFDGAGGAERGMGALAAAGVPFGVNVVLTRETLPHLEETLERARALGAREAQLLRYKPAGRARDAGYLARRLTPAQTESLFETLEAVRGRVQLPMRIDCALVPLLSGADLDAVHLERFGVLGCEAGRHLAGVRVDGRVSPCSFGPATDVTSLSAETYGSDETLAAWRALPDDEPCASCSLRSVCRGGCRVVSEHVLGRLGPDPECPRVRAHAGDPGTELDVRT